MKHKVSIIEIEEVDTYIIESTARANQGFFHNWFAGMPGK